MNRIHPDEMPAPDALINYHDGFVGAVMFHYAPDDCSDEVFRAIARTHGFEINGMHMRTDDPLYPEYESGSHLVVGKWEPDIPEGWQLGGKHDTEDGPYVIFLRPLKNEAHTG